MGVGIGIECPLKKLDNQMANSIATHKRTDY